MKKLFLSKDNFLIIFCGIISIVFVACKSQKYAECEQMITLGNNVTKQTQAIAQNSSDRDQDLKNWLEASNIMKQAAVNMEALEIKDPKLLEYRGSLVNIYRVYSQATYNAVKARENKNLKALQSARGDVEKNAEVNSKLVKDINNYCLKK